ncbi:MAG: flagellar basal body P-ring protein FlgI [Candidatus Marinarcus sp.]|uniref:flagellar basal body P-ring protein FlgI n=1 Tax=Candidatus Marinarcus sp. TaxID=3100987 RepID=UPI003AFF8192
MKYFIGILFIITSVYSQTIKDISSVVGIRQNQLIGYGLVVGLAGTGDKSKFTMQSLQNLLRNSYIKIPTSSINSKNIAAVMVTAELPAFARQGDSISVKVSAIGDAKSIDQGELLLTQLKGVDGTVYALAQGTILSTPTNKTTGDIFNGAIIENELDYSLQDENDITLSLFKASAKYADLIETKINDRFGSKLAIATDTRTITAKKPADMSIVKFLSIIQNIQIDSDFKKKIIIDMQRETIIAGADIVIQPVTITRDTFTLRIKKTDLTNNDWNDPAKNMGQDIGDSVKIDQKPTIINLDNALVNTKNLPTVSDLMRAMKVMKLPIADIIETLKMIKDLGAIDVEMEIRG